jgi:SAM-dependent methyltransferase
VVNVGAGTGSYEPDGVLLLAVEPSSTMIAQQPAGAAPAVRATAERLPLRDGAVDVGLAVLTVHHWTDPAAGLAELVRVSRRQVVLTWDAAGMARSCWLLADYLPEIGRHRAWPTTAADAGNAAELAIKWARQEDNNKACLRCPVPRHRLPGTRHRRLPDRGSRSPTAR